MSRDPSNIYGGRDPREVPSYPISYAASLVGVPVSTLRAWVAGRSYPIKSGRKRAPAVIEQVAAGYLSFTNLVEAHALAAMRREYQLKLDKIRSAVQYVQRKLGVEHPLARQHFKTDGVELFIERFGKLLNVSQDGQLAIREAFDARLERVDYERGLAVRLFPLVRATRQEQPRLIVIDPEVGFGRPVLSGTGIPVSIIHERFKAGDSASDLARDFGVGVDAIEEALRAA
ncbi:MAG: DUF433 domain-containing protein [Polyangiaceae bacterium]|nr:DUF433 domain-containing protein [Polyangiaceae bacterium]